MLGYSKRAMQKDGLDHLHGQSDLNLPSMNITQCIPVLSKTVAQIFLLLWFQKNLTTVNVLKFQTLYSILFWPTFCFLCVVFKILSGMANSIDPDQTAPNLI